MYRRAPLAYRIAESFFRHWSLFSLSAIAVAGVVILVTLGRPATYVASASTQVITETELTSALGFDRTSWITPAQQNVDRFYNLMRDDLPGGFIDSFLRRAQLAQPISLDPEKHDPRLVQLRKALYASADSSDVFTLTLIWDNPRETERLVQAAQTQFIEETGMASQASSIATANFLDSQIEIYRKRMQTAEKALIDYKQTHAGQLPEAQASQLDLLGQLQAEMDYLKITQHDGDLRRAAIQQRLAQIQPVNVQEQIIAESPEQQQIKQLDAQRNSLIADGWLATSIRVQDIDDEIRALKQKQAAAAKQSQKPIGPGGAGQVTETRLQSNPEYEDLTSQLTQNNIDQQTQQARMALLQAKIDDYRKQIALLPAAERALTERTRDYDILKSQFENLLQRREQARIKGNLEKVAATSTLRPLGSVLAQSTQSRKKQAIGIGVALVLGLLTAGSLLLLHEAIDQTFWYPEDAERVLDLPVLAYIPDSAVLLDGSARSRSRRPASLPPMESAPQ